MKTLENIKEYFKDALIVEGVTEDNPVKGNFNNIDNRGIHEWNNAFWIFDNDKFNICLYDNDFPQDGFAKILETR